MDAAARRAKRAKELQEKKKKLEMLRRKRRERDQKHATSSSSSSTTSSPAINNNKQQTNNESIDDLVDNILSTPPPPSVLLHTKQSDNNEGKTSAKRSILSQEQDMNNGTRDDESKTSVDNNQDNLSKRRPLPVQLTQQSFEILNIPSKLNTVSYSKSVQTTYTGDDLLPKTDRDDDENNGGNSNDDDDDDGVTLPKSLPPRLSSSTSIASIKLDVNDGNINNTNGTIVKETSELNEQEKESIINSTSFQEFFKRTSAICERALNDTFDPTISYGASATEETIDDIKECLILEHTFYDQKFSSNRAISDINWNPHYKELFLTSMVPLNSGIHHGGVNDISNVGPSTPSNSSNNNNSNSNGSSSASNSTNTSGTRANNISNQLLTPNGIVLVWSLRRPKTPEYVFTTQSAVTCALFDRYSTNFILGATYSGQIVLWDMRASNRPVQRSPLSADCHTHPVFNAKIVGTTNNHEVITVSTDGRLCTWNLGQLDQPAETMMLKHGNKDIAVTNMAFPPSGDNNTFFCGSEDGCVYTSQVHSNKAQGGTKKFEGHYGPITGMDFASSFNGKNSISSSSSSSNSNINNINNGKKHNNNNRYDRLLTSSMDWTVKLWSYHPNDPRTPLKCEQTFSGGRDSIYDAKWCPSSSNDNNINNKIDNNGDMKSNMKNNDQNYISNSMFATVGGEGNLSLWDLEKEMETSISSINVGEALNKCQWNLNGDYIAVGGVSGKTYIYRNTTRGGSGGGGGNVHES